MPRRLLKSEHTDNSGFVLIATLALLALLITTLLTLTNYLRIQSDLVQVHRQRQVAKQHALVGLDLAIEKLQRHTGPDQVSTCPASTLFEVNSISEREIGTELWTYANGTEPAWLVSSENTPHPFESINPQSAISLVSKGTLGSSSPQEDVIVESVSVRRDKASQDPNTIIGRYAFWIGELNTKANITINDTLQETSIDPKQYSSIQLSLPTQTGTEVVFGENEKASDPDILSRILVQQQGYEIGPSIDLIQRHFHHMTTQSKGLLTNSKTGGFKLNLSDIQAKDDLITHEIQELIRPAFYLTKDQSPESYKIRPNNSNQPSRIIEPLDQGDPLILMAPILTEFQLSMGIFINTTGSGRGDYFHRVRFHIHSEWLNPFPRDFGFSNPKSYYLMVDDLPKIKVTNVDNDMKFQADLGHFDTQLRSNNLSKSNINSYLKLSSLSNPNDAIPFGIDSGSVYKLRSPNDRDGLARTISEQEWAIIQGPAPLDGRRATIDDLPVLYFDDTIRIHSIEESYKINITLAPIPDSINTPPEKWWEAPMEPGTSPNKYLEAHGYSLKLKNIPFDKFDFTLTGQTYQRHTSSYSESDYRIAFHFRLKDDPRTLGIIANKLALHDAVLDFDEPEILNAFEITKNPREAASSGTSFSGLDLFYDSKNESNSNVPNQHQFHLFDIPIREPVSVGVFSQLRFHNRPHPWIGSAEAKDWNQIYDRYYFSGSKRPRKNLSQEIENKSSIAETVLLNPRIQPIPQANNQLPSTDDMCHSEGAKYSFINGMFNIHSSSIQAWSMVLKNQLKNEATGIMITDSTGTNSVAKNVFARLPFSTPDIDHLLSDSAIQNKPNPSYYHFRQGVRSIDDARGKDRWIRSLSQNIIREISDHVQKNEHPISSLQELANSGAIQRAIDSTVVDGKGLNEGIPPLAPQYLRQTDILALLSPIISVRSDTFVIRSYGECLHSQTGKIASKAYCEAIIQRYPDYVDSKTNPPTDLPVNLNRTNRQLGRAYKIIQFRWLQPHEI